MDKELEAIDTVARAIDRISRRGRFADFKLQNGIVLGCRPIPPLMLQAVNDAFKLPDPPVVYMEEKGRDEPNPNDPTYLKECNEILEKQELALEDLTLAVGTWVKEVPEEYFKPEEDGWISSVEFASKLTGVDLEIDKEDPTKLYLQWLRFYALESTSDILMAKTLSGMLSGIREGEVDEVMQSFRRLPSRGTDNVGETETGISDGDTGNRAERRARSRVRGA